MIVDSPHFLLVEDDATHAKLVKLALSEEQDDVTLDWVSDGEQALAYIGRQAQFSNKPRPDVILLDLNLPRVDGHEVLRQIKDDPDLRTIPVVILTTSSTHSDKTRAYQNHANSYLTKPLDFDDFHQMVRDLKLYWTVWNQPVSARSN